MYGPHAARIAGRVAGQDFTGFGPFQNARLEYGGDLVIAARRDALGLEVVHREVVEDQGVEVAKLTVGESAAMQPCRNGRRA